MLDDKIRVRWEPETVEQCWSKWIHLAQWPLFSRLRWPATSINIKVYKLQHNVFYWTSLAHISNLFLLATRKISFNSMPTLVYNQMYSLWIMICKSDRIRVEQRVMMIWGVMAFHYHAESYNILAYKAERYPEVSDVSLSCLCPLFSLVWGAN